jgi:hypothetical protein
MYFLHSSEALVTIRRVAEGRCTINSHYTNYAIFCNANTKITPVQEFLLYFNTLKNFRTHFSLCEFSDISFLFPRYRMFWNGLLTVILSTQNRPTPSPPTYVTSTVKSLSSAHLYVVWFPRAKAKYQVCMKCRNLLSHSSRRFVLKLFLIILPTTDRGTKVKEDSVV